MSVTKHGVKGYEYQYKVTVLVALLQGYLSDKKLFVEIEGSEDAKIVDEQNNSLRIIEVQVKRENEAITIKKLTDWLCHFQERKADNNLLYRVSSEDATMALFVTRARCSDETVSLKADFDQLSQHNEISISKDRIVESLKNRSFGSSALMRGRETFCSEQASTLADEGVLNSTFKKVLIWEEASEERIDREVTTLLNRKYRIAESKTIDVYRKLLEVVREGRDTSADILPLVQNTISKNKIGRPRVDTHYQDRGEEKGLNAILDKDGVLLLTGISLCGKSEIAKKLASNFYEKGYDYKLTSEIEQVERFFLSNEQDAKVAILEDPFGHIDPVREHYQIRRRLESLIKNAQAHHKLLVTSRLEILLEINNTGSLDDCSINSVVWHDITINDVSTLRQYWQQLVEKMSLSATFSEEVSGNLLSESSSHLLQIGQLSYLANQEPNTLVNKEVSELEHIARHNSKDIAGAIKEKDAYYTEVLFVLSLCCNTIEDIAFTELAFILSDNEECPSIKSEDDVFISYGHEEPQFPTYSKQYTLSTSATQAIEYLEDRQLVKVSDENIVFSHPNYLQAGRYLLPSTSETRKKRYISYLRRGVACLASTNAYLAVKSLPFVAKNVCGHLREEVMKVGFMGLRSIFPSVEDISLIFLTESLADLNEQDREVMIKRIQHGGTDSPGIHWHNNELPFISNKRGTSNLFATFDDASISDAKIDLAEGRLPNGYKTWAYLNSLDNNASGSAEEFRILLQHNESFIRKKVAFLAFRELDVQTKDIAEQIFSDDHPSVVFAGIRAVFVNWYRYSEAFRQFLFGLLEEALSKFHVAIRAFSLISTFSIDYSAEAVYNWDELDKDQTKDLWQLWGKLYPLANKGLPTNLSVDTARFSASMDEAVKYLDVETGMSVIETWFNRIDYKTNHDLILDEFELCVADNLMELTGDDHKSRKDIFTKLIHYPDTNFILSSLKWIVNDWDKLHTSEKDQITTLLESERKDIRWIKAVLLTSWSPPQEITQSLLEIDSLNQYEVEEVLSKFSQQLLRDCLNVYNGFPQPLWWLAIHGKNPDFWNKVIRSILYDETHTGFDICLQRFLGFGVNGFSSEWSDWKERWTRVCACTKNKKLLVECLTFNTARCSCSISTVRDLWSILIQSYADVGSEGDVVDLVAKNIELLQQTGHREDLLEIFDGKFLNKVISKLQPDSMILSLTNLLKNIPLLENEKIEIASTTSSICRDKGIRFFFTFAFIEDLANNDDLPVEAVNHLLAIPNSIDETGKNKLQQLESQHEYKLDNWIGIN